MEEFADIVGYEGLYQVSKNGVVKSLDRIVGDRRLKYKGRILKQNNCLGYHTVNLCKNSLARPWYVHRLVALHFIPNPENKPSINHINGNKGDNKICNLEWNTYLENNLHKVRVLGRANKRNKGKTVNQIDIRTKEVINSFQSSIYAAQSLNRGSEPLRDIAHNISRATLRSERKKGYACAYGFIWQRP